MQDFVLYVICGEGPLIRDRSTSATTKKILATKVKHNTDLAKPAVAHLINIADLTARKLESRRVNQLDALQGLSRVQPRVIPTTHPQHVDPLVANTTW